MAIAAWASLVASVFTAGIYLGAKGNAILVDLGRTQAKLDAIPTQAFLQEAIDKAVEAARQQIIDELSSDSVHVQCPNVTIRGLSYRPCPIFGLRTSTGVKRERP